MAIKKKHITIGDIAEIKTSRGLAYIQYTHDGKDSGEIVRVLPGLYSCRPEDFIELAKQRELYFVFFTLKYAVRAGQAEIISNQPVPEWAKDVPLMRHSAGTTPEGRTTNWRIVPALAPLTLDFLQGTPVIRQLSPEQKRLSIRELWPPPVMVKELAREWTPERAEELEEQDRAQARVRASQERPANGGTVRHYLYFRERQNAEKAAQWFRTQGFLVDVKLSGDGENWLALVKHSSPTDADAADKLRGEMETLASQLDGEYDGWESAV